MLTLELDSGAAFTLMNRLISSVPSKSGFDNAVIQVIIDELKVKIENEKRLVSIKRASKQLRVAIDSEDGSDGIEDAAIVLLHALES